jgi:L-lactate dehydrogenase complex protein LldG
MEPDTSSSSREIILSRIRSALLTQSEPRASDSDWSAIPRAFRRCSDASTSVILELLTERLRDYDAQVLHAHRSDVTQAIAQMLTARGATSMLVPLGFPEAFLPEGFDYVRDEALTTSLLDTCSGVITTCTLAIAETGTIVLQNAPGQGRRAASLVPDYHLCLIEATNVVATVPEAIAALQPTATLPTTFISGPSATADIEMTRIKGVHGPRFLDVILIA